MKTVLVDAVNTFVLIDEGVFGEMQSILDSYPNKKIILTGANDEQIKKFGLDNVPYELFTLKHNPEKTDPKYYKVMLKKYNLKPKDAVYLEHNPEAVRVANSLGITTLHYDKDKKDLKELRKFLDNNL